MNRRFALLGMPGSGKTTTGLCMANKLGLPFYDLDQYIEQLSGKSIPEIFHKQGEQEFRLLESAMLEQFLHQAPEQFILATGGGTPCFFQNMDLLNKHCKTIFLDPELEVIQQRLVGTNHPILKQTPAENVMHLLKELKKNRLAYYSKSHLTVEPKAINSPYLFTKALYLFTSGKMI